MNQRKLAARLKASFDHAIQQVRDERHRLKDARKQLRYTEAAQEILQSVAQFIQQQAHTQIAGIVTRCLQAVFVEPYEFKIDFVKRRGKTEAVLSFVENGHELDPTDGSGGGLLDVAAFALRVSSIILTRPSARRFLVLDEPFRFISQKRMNRDRVKVLLETLSEELEVQILMVTHDEELVAGKVVEIVKKGSRSQSRKRAKESSSRNRTGTRAKGLQHHQSD